MLIREAQVSVPQRLSISMSSYGGKRLKFTRIIQRVKAHAFKIYVLLAELRGNQSTQDRHIQLSGDI